MTNSSPVDLLIVDDDHDFRHTLARRLERDGFAVQHAADGPAALTLAARREFDVAVVDMRMPGMSGLELLEQFKLQHADCEVIMLTGQGTIESAVNAMKLGAFDYLTKPFPMAELESRIAKARERRQLRMENQRLKTLLRRHEADQAMIGESASMKEVFRLIERVGPTDKAVLIQGESGTGKELVARALHVQSGRRDKPMVVINCAALPETLLESELFGHEKGAFTGAVCAKQGLFEVADGGTLFIDEIGEMPGFLQAKLLRVLEDGSLRRIGSIKERRVDVRLIVATHRDLARQVANGQFREDLYYRIDVVSINLPPLRERPGDIPILLRHFATPGWELEPRALDVLSHYDWPGNVRQLINAVERAKIMAEGERLGLEDFPREVIESGREEAADSITDLDDLAVIERTKVVEVLRREAGNKSRAARTLGIERRKLYRLIEKHAIKPEEVGQPTRVMK